MKQRFSIYLNKKADHEKAEKAAYLVAQKMQGTEVSAHYEFYNESHLSTFEVDPGVYGLPEVVFRIGQFYGKELAQ